MKSLTAASTALLSGEVLPDLEERSRRVLLGERDRRGDLDRRRGLRERLGLRTGLFGLRLLVLTLPESLGLLDRDLRAL